METHVTVLACLAYLEQAEVSFFYLVSFRSCIFMQGVADSRGWA